MKFWPSRTPATPGEGALTEAEQARLEIVAGHRACETAENGTGARCTCSFDCANYWLRAKGHKQENQ